MEVKSTPQLVHIPMAALHAQLTDFHHFGHSLPPQVINYRVEGDTCSFTLQGLADISLHIFRKDPDHIIYSNTADKPFPFHLHFFLYPEDENTCQLMVAFEGDLNPMLALIVRGPLQNFVNLLAEKIASHISL